MKKEIKVWVNELNIRSMAFRPLEANMHLYKKATLIVDVPEPKIEITRSELEKILKDNHYNYIVIGEISNGLFGEEE